MTRSRLRRRCRARVPAFTARHFGLAGTLRLHREALGWDLLLAPLNVLLVGPALFVRMPPGSADRWACRASPAGWRAATCSSRRGLSRRIADLVLNELLGLDHAHATRRLRPGAIGRAI